MRALVEAGADVRAEDEQGFTALLNAVKVRRSLEQDHADIGQGNPTCRCTRGPICFSWSLSDRKIFEVGQDVLMLYPLLHHLSNVAYFIHPFPLHILFWICF